MRRDLKVPKVSQFSNYKTLISAPILAKNFMNLIQIPTLELSGRFYGGLALGLLIFPIFPH